MTASSRSRLVRLRALARQIHLWITLIVGLPVAIISAAGLPITYWFDTDMLTSRNFFTHQGVGTGRLSLDALVSSARTASRAARVDSISFSEPGSVAIVSAPLPGMEEREIALEPTSGQVVAIRDRHQATVEWLYSLHTRLLLDRIGADLEGQILIVGLAICTVILILSGIILWWPRHFAWSSISPLLRWSRLWSDLHTKAGLYSLPALTLASITTVLLTYPATRSTAGRVISYENSSSAGHATSGPPSLQAAAQTAGQVDPNRRFAELANIDEPSKPYLVGIGDDVRGYRWVDIDRHSGALLEVRSEPSREGDHPAFLIGLHQGHRFGKVGQLLFGISSLVPLLLYTSGLFIWWQRRQRLRTASRRP